VASKVLKGPFTKINSFQVSSTLEVHEELKDKYQSTLEEKQILNDKYETAKKELDEAITKLEEQMNLDKSEKEFHISKLERQITMSELKYMEEVCCYLSPSELFGSYVRSTICIISQIFSDPDHAS
jgi:predicted nuclease with TOPRIM domain